ncbi:type II toxin-antitoxin system HipA family toxin [Pseudomonas sp. NY15349]|jgi:serine/threonine-protein kinase HipA|uniref:type II toxin-antitoxin system HipA family toxin n=1 Tax=unclassified Pseudomonas TaxID=196821 RepID=UPI001F467043|nr:MULTISPECIES: HipA domain-containing protein [unclassified Pseudomonas]MCE5988090.1 HipA domain-containing protein [Pseudomonas sp. LM20]MCE5992162.1 HipA domain-containing protein [Pseudomonas sp. KCA11]UMY61634.1 HipA domain-containing protein [Pseudomonas sp. LS.1a]
MYRLTLQLHDQGKWHDAIAIAFAEPERSLSSPCEFGYTSNYVKANLHAYDSLFSLAASAKLPVDFGSHRLPHAPAFLYDIAPAGAAKRFLLRHIGRERPAGMGEDLFLLGRSTPAPIGNMRIRESAELLDLADPIGFARQDVIVRDQRFLEYAYEQGAAIGGATGAGGEAPKLLMTEDENGQLYPDAVLADEGACRHWFIKFARHPALADDQEILRAEYLYYRALQQLGIETVASEHMALEEGAKPSLWMERFDRQVTDQGVQRFAVESMYSLCGVTEPGSRMGHLEVIETLVGLWKMAGQGKEVPDLIADYLRRDLINKILGNADNHGRNTAIIRTRDTVRLAPIYDLAPMVMDQEGVTRTTKWPALIERAGEIDWHAACVALAEFIDPDEAYQRLRQEARHLLALPDILSGLGLPEAVMNHPAIALGKLERRMAEWGLA